MEELGCFLDTPYTPVREISRSREHEMWQDARTTARYRTIRERGGSCPARQKPPFPSSCHSVPRWTRRAAGEFAGPPIGCASRRREGSATFPDRLHGIDSSPREFPARKKREERRSTAIRDAGFMLNGLDSGMRALDGLPSRPPFVSPRLHHLLLLLLSVPFIRRTGPSSSSSRNRIVRGPCRPPTKGTLRWR